jgi:hypothetical protein
MSKDTFHRPRTIGVIALVAALSFGLVGAQNASAEAPDDSSLAARFKHLSQHGNVECSGQFEKSIATMPQDAKLQGSCCAPMDEVRYGQQIEGLKKYADIAEVPPDPYDIAAPLAHKWAITTWRSTRMNRLLTTMRWSTPKCRGHVAANVGAGKCMAV